MKYIIISLSAVFLLACQNRPKQAVNDTPDAIQEISARADTPLSFMKNHIGKHPADIDFFNIPIIQERLQTLVGENYDQISKCVVESQISKYKDDYIVVSICFPHECNTVFAEIFLNHTTDNISLYYRNYDEHYFLSENGKIGSEFDKWK